MATPTKKAGRKPNGRTPGRRKSGRKPIEVWFKDKAIGTSMVLTRTADRLVQAAAKRSGHSRSDVIEWCIRQASERLLG